MCHDGGGVKRGNEFDMMVEGGGGETRECVCHDGGWGEPWE